MKKYLVTSRMAMVVKAMSKAKALDEFYDHTDGTEYIEEVKLIKRKRKKK